MARKRYTVLTKLVDRHFKSRDLIGVEIGVHHAVTTVHLLTHSRKIAKYYAIDPYVDREYRTKITQAALAKYEKCTFLHTTSHEARTQVPDGIDFIFIDGDASYEGFLMDLEDWVPKLKSGGLVTAEKWTRSAPAVEQYLKTHGPVLQEDARWPDLKRGRLWWRVKV